MESAVHIAGTGSFAAEIAGWARDAGIEVAGLVELRDPARVGGVVHGLPVLAVERPPASGRAIIGLGGDRRGTWEALAASGWLPAGLIHPSAHVAETAEVAPTATLGPLAVVGAETVVGEHAILSRGVLVGHHVRVGGFATLNPGVNVGGNTEVGDDAFLGMGCTVVNGIAVGDAATVGAGALAIGDVAAGARVQGVPARPYEGG